MAQNHTARTRGLRLATHADDKSRSSGLTDSEQKQPQRPSFLSEDSTDTIRRISATATPPIEIPGQRSDSHDVAVEGASSLQGTDAYVEQYLKERKPSISFNTELTTDTGHRHSILEPPRRANEDKPRGRSLAQALSDSGQNRPHSESDKTHYDPRTGRQLPQYSDSPPYEEPRIGEARFPLLQRTVDELARIHSRDGQPMSMTSESTMSPTEEAVLTPNDNVSSPIAIMSPSLMKALSSSYEPPVPRPRSQRKASERWREGEAAPDFFARAGSLKKGDGGSLRRSNRRDTNSVTRSPKSAASSFLRGFSVSSGTDDAAVTAVDAEGATVGEDYVLGKQIGWGGFSIIREVKQISSQTGKHRTLAVKIVKKQIDGKSKDQNDKAQADFEHEVDLWRLLNHKHVLALEAVYELKEATFCFVPLNTGGTLFDVMTNNRQGLSLDLAANYSYQIASALRYLHLDARVVHRDVKLENCLIDTTATNGLHPGHLRICDFGLAEWISSSEDSSSASTSSNEREHTPNKYFGPADSSTSAFAGGSLEYAAPEVLQLATSASGNVHRGEVPPEKIIISPAVDIWAFGVCMYALLCGRRPFADSFQPRVVMAILAGDYNMELLKEKAGSPAYQLVTSCLLINAKKRPTIGEVFESSWFDDARSSVEGSDDGSESARASGWRL